jgi:replication-associated recombination protein RarA
VHVGIALVRRMTVFASTSIGVRDPLASANCAEGSR